MYAIRSYYETKVLTTRLAYLLSGGFAQPWQILAVTFTNRAAREMRERVSAMIGDAAASVALGTFHALGARMLRRDGERIGLPRDRITSYNVCYTKLLRILPDTGLDQAEATAETIRAALAARSVVNRRTRASLGQVTLSLGIAELRADESHADLLRRAAAAVDEAKAGGSNRVVRVD